MEKDRRAPTQACPKVGCRDGQVLTLPGILSSQGRDQRAGQVQLKKREGEDERLAWQPLAQPRAQSSLQPGCWAAPPDSLHLWPCADRHYVPF